MCIRLPPLTFIFATNQVTISHIINLQFYYTGILYFAILFVSYVYYWVFSNLREKLLFHILVVYKQNHSNHIASWVIIFMLPYNFSLYSTPYATLTLLLHLKHSTSCAIRILQWLTSSLPTYSDLVQKPLIENILENDFRADNGTRTHNFHLGRVTL